MLLVSLIAHLDKEDVYLRDRFAYLVILPKGKAVFGSDWQNYALKSIILIIHFYMGKEGSQS